MSTATSCSVPSTLRAHAPGFTNMLNKGRIDSAPAFSKRVLCNIDYATMPGFMRESKKRIPGEPLANSALQFLPPIIVAGMSERSYMPANNVFARLYWAAMHVSQPSVSRFMADNVMMGIACLTAAVRSGIIAFLGATPYECDDVWSYLLSIETSTTGSVLVMNSRGRDLTPIEDAYCSARISAPPVTNRMSSFLTEISRMGPEFLRLALVAYSGRSITSMIDIGLTGLSQRAQGFATSTTTSKLALTDRTVWEAALVMTLGGFSLEYLVALAYDPLLSPCITHMWDSDYPANMAELASQHPEDENNESGQSTPRAVIIERPGTSCSSVVTFASFALAQEDEPAPLTTDALAELRVAVEGVVQAAGPLTYDEAALEERFVGF